MINPRRTSGGNHLAAARRHWADGAAACLAAVFLLGRWSPSNAALLLVGAGLVVCGLAFGLPGLLARRAASTAATYYKVLKVLYGWLEEEDELPGPNPMAKMKPPLVPEQPVPVVPQTASSGCWQSAPARTSRTAATAP